MKDEWTIYWWEVTDEDSDSCGEEFFTELNFNATFEEHEKYAKKLSPGEKITCHGKVSRLEAEMMGLDTY